jgi:sec-independent protein translocase protein TatB
MFGVDTTEFLIVAVAALIFIGPKELPGAMRTVGRWVGKARAHARHFTAGIENMMREAELEEMEKRWREENERIMREHPMMGPLPYAGASESLDERSTSLPSTTLQASGEAVDASGNTGPSDVEARTPPLPSLGEEEPTLPLPEPDHHRRELP